MEKGKSEERVIVREDERRKRRKSIMVIKEGIEKPDADKYRMYTSVC